MTYFMQETSFEDIDRIMYKYINLKDGDQPIQQAW